MASNQSHMQKQLKKDAQQRSQEDSRIAFSSSSSSSSSVASNSSDINFEEQKRQILENLMQEQRQKLIRDAKNEFLTYTLKTQPAIDYLSLLNKSDDSEWKRFMAGIQRILSQSSNTIVNTGSFGSDARRESLQVFKSASTFLMLDEYRRVAEQGLDAMERDVLTPLRLEHTRLSHFSSVEESSRQEVPATDLRVQQLEKELQIATQKSERRKEKIKKLELVNREQTEELLPLRERVNNLQSQLTKAEQREDQTNANLRMSLAVAVDETKLPSDLQNFRRDSIAKFSRNMPAGGLAATNPLFAPVQKSESSSSSSSERPSSNGRMAIEERLQKYCSTPRGQVLTALGKQIQENNIGVVPYFNLIKENPATVMSTLAHIQNLRNELPSDQSSLIMSLVEEETQEMINSLYNMLKPQMSGLGLSTLTDLNKFLSKKVDEFAKRIKIEDKLSSTHQRALN